VPSPYQGNTMRAMAAVTVGEASDSGRRVATSDPLPHMNDSAIIHVKGVW
jgi:hypothetical protein